MYQLIMIYVENQFHFQHFLPIKLDETFEATSVPFLIPDFVNQITLPLTCYIEAFYINIKLEFNLNLTLPFEKIFRFFNNEKYCRTSALFRFPVKLICFIAFGSASSFCCLLKSIAISLQYSLKYRQSSKHPVV